jgi:hypothetical protein
MIRRYAFLPLAMLALTGLSACGKDDPFEDKTYIGCLDADSITFHADGRLTAIVDGEPVDDRFIMTFENISDTKVKVTSNMTSDPAYAELLDDGSLSFTVPTSDIDQICEPQE